MSTAKPALLSFLQDRMLIGDGAMATQLYQMGVPVGVCYEELNVSRAEIVARVHRSYYDAGARLIETNTFGAHSEGLARYGLEDRLAEINRAAVRVAREAVGADAYIAATVGSISGVRRNFAPPVDLVRAYSEQVAALLEEGPDAVLLETFLDLEELLLAVGVVRRLCDLPIIAQLAPLDLAVTRDGHRLQEAFQALRAAGASVTGLNCRFGPADMQRALRAVAWEPDALISIFPNAGLLSVTDGHYHYPSEPAYFASAALEFHALGVRVIGGCCGTSPAHIRAMAEAVAHLAPHAPGVAGADAADVPAALQRRDETRAHILESAAITQQGGVSGQPLPVHEKVLREHTVIVELDPPKDLATDVFLRGAQALREAGADAVTLADNSLAVTRMSNIALGALMKQRGVEPLLHISCRDRNLIGQQSHLMGLHALGIRQVLVITGDPSRFGDLPGATSVFDVSSFDMIRMVKQLNAGVAFSGRQLSEASSFVVGAAFNPNVRHFDKAIRRLERKVEAGADFIMTQPVFDPNFFAVLKEATRHLPVPLFVGIMPLLSHRNAEFLHNEVPGISLSNEVRTRMAQYEGRRAREEGLAIARELLDAATPHFNGIYLITPLLRYELTVALTQHVKNPL
ncbi:MAG: bifunctional homocysteine S-methyltransferase/methylenetetrahydrofolate reductase [Bacilli bacterium]